MKRRRKDSKEVIQKMKEWDALPIEEKLKKIQEMQKKGLDAPVEEGDDLTEDIEADRKLIEKNKTKEN